MESKIVISVCYKVVAKSIFNEFYFTRLKTILEFGGVLAIVGKPSPSLI